MRFLAVGMFLAGMSKLQISNKLRVPRSTIIFWLKRFQDSGDVEEQKRCGRPRATSREADRQLICLCESNRFASSSMLLTDWGESVSARTARKRLNEQGLFSKKPVVRPWLSPSHVSTRLAWAMSRCHFRESQWSRIIFTDESRFQLHSVDGRIRVWRRADEQLQPDCVRFSLECGGGSVHVWGAISSNSRSDLIILRENVNGERYKRVLNDHLMPWASASLGDPQVDWKFQDDNAPAHRARCVQEEKQRLGIRSISWPPRSPDLNPIEHVWNFLKWKMARRVPRLNSIAQLATALKEEWSAIPQERIRSLIASMPNRVRSVITAKGGSTSY